MFEHKHPGHRRGGAERNSERLVRRRRRPPSGSGTAPPDRRRTAPARAACPRTRPAGGRAAPSARRSGAAWNARISGGTRRASAASSAGASARESVRRIVDARPQDPRAPTRRERPEPGDAASRPADADRDRLRRRPRPTRPASADVRPEELQRDVPVLRRHPAGRREPPRATARSRAATTSRRRPGHLDGDEQPQRRRRPVARPDRAPSCRRLRRSDCRERLALEVPPDAGRARPARPTGGPGTRSPGHVEPARMVHARRRRARATPSRVGAAVRLRARPRPSARPDVGAEQPPGPGRHLEGARLAHDARARRSSPATRPGRSASRRRCRRRPTRRSSPRRRATGRQPGPHAPSGERLRARERRARSPAAAAPPPPRAPRRRVVNTASPEPARDLVDERREQRLGLLRGRRLRREPDLHLARRRQVGDARVGRTPSNRSSEHLRDPRLADARRSAAPARRSWPARRAPRAPGRIVPSIISSISPGRPGRVDPRAVGELRRPARARCPGSGMMVRHPSGTSAWRRLLSGMSPRPKPANRSRSRSSISGCRTIGDAQHLGDRVARDVVLGRAEPARHQHDVGPVERHSQRLDDPLEVVARPPGDAATSTPTAASRSEIHRAFVFAICPSSSSVPTPTISALTPLTPRRRSVGSSRSSS